jgi:hypothetical protein
MLEGCSSQKTTRTGNSVAGTVCDKFKSVRIHFQWHEKVLNVDCPTTRVVSAIDRHQDEMRYAEWQRIYLRKYVFTNLELTFLLRLLVSCT